MNKEKYMDIIKSKIDERKLSNFTENSEEFSHGLMIGLETMYQYFTDNYQCIKKRTNRRNKCQTIRKGKRKKLLSVK